MKFMTRTLALILTIVACFSLFGCAATPSKPLTEPAPTQNAPTEATVPYGYKVGERCPGYDIPRIDGNGDTGKTVDPTSLGKITVINFWGTWCNPCVSELPHFDQFASDHADKVAVVAIHSVGDSKHLTEFLAENYPDPHIIFGRDVGTEFNGEYFTMLGGLGSYPYTLVLDAQGIVRYSQVGMMSYEELESVILEIDPDL